MVPQNVPRHLWWVAMLLVAMIVMAAAVSTHDRQSAAPPGATCVEDHGLLAPSTVEPLAAEQQAALSELCDSISPPWVDRIAITGLERSAKPSDNHYLLSSANAGIVAARDSVIQGSQDTRLIHLDAGRTITLRL